MTSLELATDEIQVWVASLDVGDDRYDELAALLPADEQKRATSLSPIAARRFVVARGILRGLLSGFTGTPPLSLQFSYGVSGKPDLIDHEGIHFNISHSADLGLFAFAPDGPVGVDVESNRPVRRLLDVAQRFMSEDELRALAQASPEDRNTAFLKSWVVREARLKAQGKGIWSGSGTSAETSLTHRLFAPAPNFIAAVAAPRAGWRLYTCAMKE